VYLKRCEIFSGGLSIRFVTAFYHAARHRHSKYGRAHADGITGWLSVSNPDPHRHSTDSFGLSPNVPDMQIFLRRNCTVINYNTVQLQGPMSTACGKYCCLLALNTDRGYTGQQFVGLFTPGQHADLQVERLFVSEFGALPGGGMCCTSRYKR